MDSLQGVRLDAVTKSNLVGLGDRCSSECFDNSDAKLGYDRCQGSRRCKNTQLLQHVLEGPEAAAVQIPPVVSIGAHLNDFDRVCKRVGPETYVKTDCEVVQNREFSTLHNKARNDSSTVAARCTEDHTAVSVHVQ